MPEVIFTGPAGRLEGRFHPSKQRGAPIAVILHPHPQFGGTMNNQIVYQLYYAFAERGFQFVGDVEMLHQRGLATAGDHAELLDAGGTRFFNGVLNQWLVDNRQHFLGGCLGRGKEARPQSGNGKYGLAQRLSHGCLTPLFDMRNHHEGWAKLWQPGRHCETDVEAPPYQARRLPKSTSRA